MSDEQDNPIVPANVTNFQGSVNAGIINTHGQVTVSQMNVGGGVHDMSKENLQAALSEIKTIIDWRLASRWKGVNWLVQTA